MNHAAFDCVPLTEAAAYWLGFLMADGCVHDGKPSQAGRSPNGIRNPHGYNPPQSSISLDLGVADADHVRAFAVFVGIDPMKVSDTRHHGKSAELRFTSAPMAATLARYGITPRKSLTACSVGVADNRHFWRGVVDGDGCMTIRTCHNKFSTALSPGVHLVGSSPLVAQFTEYARLVAPESRLFVGRCQKSRAWQTSTSGRFAMSIIRELYTDCTIALPRKLELAQRILADFDASGIKIVSFSEDTPQAHHSRGGKFLAANGETLPIAEWSRRTGIPRVTLQARKRYGWSDQRTVTEPVCIDRRKTILCTVEGCGAVHLAKGYCIAHYKQAQKGTLHRSTPQ